MIDVHGHLYHARWYPDAFQAALLKDFEQRQARRGRSNARSIANRLLKMLADDTGDATLRIMDTVGIERRIILILDWGVQLGEAECSITEIHQQILAVCRCHQDRLIGFAGIDPRRPNACELLRWAFDDLGARGLKLHPTGDWGLADESTSNVVGVAAERGLPVLVHLGKTVDVLHDAHAQPEPFMALAREFPETSFIAGHSAFDSWKVFVTSREVPSNIYFDISGWQERALSPGADIETDMESLHTSFPQRVMFGTDSPFYSFNLPMAEQQWVSQLGFFAGKWADAGVLWNRALSATA